MKAPWVVVTGGSAGIGRATLGIFVAAGWKALNIARRPSEVPGVIDVALDLTDAALEQRAREAFDAHLGDADRVCLVHNAGALVRDTALDAHALAELMAVNVVAPATLNRACASAFVPGSSILYVGSTLSEKAVAGMASYVTTKHALVGLMRATCQDLAGKGIHTACVCPGFVFTEMLRTRGGDVAQLTARQTMGRLVEPEEIGRVLLFCAENAAVNGAVIHANLGQIET